MGWGRFLLLGDLGQQFDISDQKQEIESLRDELRRARATSGAGNNIAQLKAENDELRLYLAALVRLLASKGVITRQELKDLVTAVDAEDGRRDNQLKGPLA